MALVRFELHLSRGETGEVCLVPTNVSGARFDRSLQLGSANRVFSVRSRIAARAARSGLDRWR